MAFGLHLPGYGNSPPGQDRATIPQYAELLADLLEEISDGPVVLVGHSMGGMISLTLALQNPALVERMGTEDGTRRSADPMDVPRAIAEIIAMPKGTRPLRRPVHPGARPQEAINTVSAETQLAMLGESQLGPWIKDVLER